MSVLIMLLKILLLFRVSGIVRAAPTPANATSPEQYLAWQSQPNIRGTWDILVNCVVTMSLCIWTALHLNLPASKEFLKNEPWWTRLWYNYTVRQVRWIIVGLLAPELVVYLAWTQSSIVKSIDEEVKRAQKAEAYVRSPAFQTKWTTTHSWYLLMGGFYFDTGDPTAQQFLPTSPRLVLTVESLEILTCTNPPLLPKIDVEVILNLSTADNFTKLLSILQAFYMVVQCISRLVSHLPISQLEINTIGHVFCAMAIYYFWWGKPKNVQVAWAIQDPWARHVCAYVWMCHKNSRPSEATYPEIACMFPIIEEQADIVKLCYNVPERDPCQTRCSLVKEKALFSEPDSWRYMTDTESSRILCEHGLPPLWPKIIGKDSPYDERFWETFDWVDLRRDQTAFIKIVMPALKQNFRFPQIDTGDQMACLRFNLALQYFQFWSQRCVTMYDNTDQTSRTRMIREDLPPFSASFSTYFTEHCHDWQPDKKPSSLYDPFRIALLTACYGGLHATAWYSHFPSLIESFAWKATALVIALSGLLIAVKCSITIVHLNLFQQSEDERFREVGPTTSVDAWVRSLWAWMVRQLPEPNRRIEDGLYHLKRLEFGQSMESTGPFTFGFLLLFIFIFMLARLFIIVEAFISLRSMPAAMYDTPDWTSWVPHL